ncbi:hypothetical protein [Streptomyces sp. NPDC094032]|uniref:hypothetical protein n=1 Tax=Streptomyces sp. NPDC094032 TaxID=3155308 RepID=UPI0033184ADF
MTSYLAIPGIVLGIALVISGVAAIRSGWVFRWQRRHVQRPAVFGWAQLVVAAGLFLQAGSLLADDSVVRSAVSLAGLGVMLAGLLVSVGAQMSKRAR